MRMNIINEDPDFLHYRGKEYAWWKYDNISFGYRKNKLYLKKNLSHEEMINGLRRGDFQYPGRLFMQPKVISFWTNMPKELFPKFIEDVYKKSKIIIDDTWKIEIRKMKYTKMDINNKYGFSFYKPQYKPQIIFQTPSKYIGSDMKQIINFDINKPHLQNPMYKQKNKISGFGSDKYKKIASSAGYPTTAHYTNTIHTEEKVIKENPDRFSFKGQNYQWNWGKNIVFGYYKNKLYANISITHWGLIKNNNYLKNQGLENRDVFQYPGRLFMEPKIISFWENPPKEFFSKFVRDIYKLTKIKINDTWLIEVEENVYKTPSEYTGKANNFDKTLSHLQNPMFKHKKKISGFGSDKYKNIAYNSGYPTTAHYTNMIHSESMSLKKILEQQRKKVVRNGKLTMKLICPKNRKAEDGSCVAMSAQEISNRKRASMKAASKRRSNKVASSAKRRKSLQKRQTMGLNTPKLK